MKEQELRKHAICSLCKRPVGSSGLPLFWVIRIERYGLNVQAIQRQDGLAALLGSSRLAEVMGANADMATPVMEPLTLTVCETCANLRELPLAAFAEVAGNND